LLELEVILDLKRKYLKVADEEIVLYDRQQRAVKIVVDTDEVLPSKRDNVISGRLVNIDRMVTGIFEPIPEDIHLGILVGRTVAATQDITPIRIMNIKCQNIKRQ
jgi:hypothetical protein